MTAESPAMARNTLTERGSFSSVWTETVFGGGLWVTTVGSSTENTPGDLGPSSLADEARVLVIIR